MVSKSMKNGKTHITIKTVLTTTLWKPPPKTGSEMTGRASLTTIFARSSVMSRRWPFLRTGRIFLAYFFCFLGAKGASVRKARGDGYGWLTVFH